MLVAWPVAPLDEDGNLLFPDLKWPRIKHNERRIFRRPSQIKYSSAHASLGAVRVSGYAGAFLNREALTILYARGIRYVRGSMLYIPYLTSLGLSGLQMSPNCIITKSEKFWRLKRRSWQEILSLIMRVCFLRQL